MRRLFRQPITWMVLSEVVVVSSLVAVAWHVFASAGVSDVVAPSVLPATSSPVDTAVPLPSAGVLLPPSPSSPRLLPGLNVDPFFWRARLAALKGNQPDGGAILVRRLVQARQHERDPSTVRSSPSTQSGSRWS